MKPFYLSLYEAIKNDLLRSFNQEMGGYFPRDQDGNPLMVDNGTDDGSITVGYIQNKKKKAVKVWEKPDPARAAQFAAASDIIAQHPSGFFTPFGFFEKALCLDQQPLDILITEWINYDTLKDYISRCLGRPERLHLIAEEYAGMQRELQQQGLGQYFFGPESIIVTSDGKLLIGDYRFKTADQSGKRNGFLCDNYASTLCTYISIKALTEKPHLWDRFLLSTRKELLFKNEDLADVTHSAIYLSLKGTSEEIDHLLEMLVDYCEKNTYSGWLTGLKPGNETPPMETAVLKTGVTDAVACAEVTLAEEKVHAPQSQPMSLPAPRSEKKTMVITDCSLEEPLDQTLYEIKRPGSKFYWIAASVILLLVAGGYFLKDKSSPAAEAPIVASNAASGADLTKNREMSESASSVSVDGVSSKDTDSTVSVEQRGVMAIQEHSASPEVNTVIQAPAPLPEQPAVTDESKKVPAKKNVSKLPVGAHHAGQNKSSEFHISVTPQ